MLALTSDSGHRVSPSCFLFPGWSVPRLISCQGLGRLDRLLSILLLQLVAPAQLCLPEAMNSFLLEPQRLS